MHRPSANEILKSNESYYSLVVGVAKRARQIAEEAEKKGELLSEKPVQLAVEEFAQGRYKIVEETDNNTENK
jgi:DNA-directed RNA polymerase subunit omega